MLNKVKYLLLVIGLLFLIPACATEPTQQELAAAYLASPEGIAASIELETEKAAYIKATALAEAAAAAQQAAADKAAATTQPEPIINGDLKDMLREYEANEVRAKDTFVGKLVQIEGKVSLIDEDSIISLKDFSEILKK